MKKLIPIFFLSLALAGLLIMLLGCDKSAENSPSPETGKGGSMARFAVTGNTLYIVSKTSLEVYDIQNGAEPVKKTNKQLGIGVETIFPYQKNLFIGTTTGMFIFDNSAPENPSLVSQYWHIQSCDPVVVQGSYAFVTLRNGVSCRPGNTLSSLDVIDISNLTTPNMISSTAMESPYGLGVTDSLLFVCEGDKGLKVMDIKDPRKPVLKYNYPDVTSYDVIPIENRLIVTGDKGLYQYTFNSTDSLKLLSKIPVL
ncbi:LVIVD repeat-containing protein [Dyadobacter sandarakinus]|uniref:LVIVD repeat-containing protein n=1 Tax=Dyadobacter sandarakinus TaxID=2747268 RepID=A0ABX7I0F7_9BACT|nr:hypothetical protein [Dyadobacter sandarakinus]QRQ99483.1 hypothetical protein HWI92_00430 [Dyadobacter sandarakinus]